jgi:hypothetical protein
MKQYYRGTASILVALALVLSLVSFAAAQEAGQDGTPEVTIEDLGGERVFGDFVVGPGKTELELAPGETRVVNILVTNRMGEEKVFDLTTEDFTGSRDPNQTVVLLGDERGPYTLKDYLSPATTTITLAHMERARIPVRVTVPTDAEPGGRYGSVLVSTATQGVGEGGTAIVSRIGVLFFVIVPGEVDAQGHLAEFDTAGSKRFFGSGPIDFRILYENTGSVHLNPSGTVTISNILGEVIGERTIEPWFALPGSLRVREISWNRDLLIGRYTARAEINRGYGDLSDEATVTFWVIPWKIALGFVLVLAIIIFAIRWVAKNISISRK